MLAAGSYKALRDMPLLIYPVEWADEYARLFELAKQKKANYPHRMTCGYILKEGQEMMLSFGERRQILSDVGEQLAKVFSVDVTVKIGSKTYTGIALTYNDYDPPIIPNDVYVRIVKKRAK
jgi:hypothetical protein